MPDFSLEKHVLYFTISQEKNIQLLINMDETTRLHKIYTRKLRNHG